MDNKARNSFIKNYFADLQHCIEIIHKKSYIINKVVDILSQARKDDRPVFTFGNGGSASTASHFACDLNKGTIVGAKRRFRVISLVDSIPTMLAWANDSSYNDIFFQQLVNLIEKDSVVIGFSGSGNSMNVINALTYARTVNLNVTSIGFIGMGGGILKKVADISIVVPSNNMQRIEDIHLILTHLITLMLRKEIEQK